uniref:Uncharacterized protein n=1 Tax=Gossypium raimondii TaxID=29730 RepID=A0A0D2Q569_GOSRA|nr:hypothetical protein B456_009G191700 [Gossypium raimondii]
MGVNNGDHSIFKGEFEEDGSMERVILSLEPVYISSSMTCYEYSFEEISPITLLLFPSTNAIFDAFTGIATIE